MMKLERNVDNSQKIMNQLSMTRQSRNGQKQENIGQAMHIAGLSDSAKSGLTLLPIPDTLTAVVALVQSWFSDSLLS